MSTENKPDIKGEAGGHFPNLFSPVTIGGLNLRNRLIMSPVGTRLARDGMVTREFKDFYAARARGGVGLIVLEACMVDIVHEGIHLLGHDDKFIPGIREVAEVIHAGGAHASIELHYPGWPLEPDTSKRFIMPMPPSDFSVDRLQELTGKFAEAARRVKEAGFDMVEIHSNHGYLLSQFLSPRTNTRTDQYGGDAEGRTRFLREIIQAIKDLVGQNFPVSCRINGAEHIAGGLTIDDAKAIAPLLEEAGADLLSITAGAIGSYPLTIGPYDTPTGCYVHLAEGIRSAVNLPVVASCRINDPYIAEDILSSRKADLVAMARALVADPELPNKSLGGHADSIRKCIACNTCLDTDFDGHITCTVNPFVGREKEFELKSAAVPKTVLVAGGGPAGLEAGRTAALRGHDVTLYEKDAELGGQWILASTPPHKQDFMDLIRWYSQQLRDLGVKIQMGQAVTAVEIDKLDPDVVIIATGATPLVPAISGVERDEVVTAWDVLKGQAEAGNRVLVVGGGATGLETAEFLATQGKKVAIVEMTERIGADVGGTIKYHLRMRLKQHGVEQFKNTKVNGFSDNGVLISTNGTDDIWTGFDTMVLAIGLKATDQLMAAVENSGKETYIIGDAAGPRKGVDSIREGAETGWRI